VVLLVIAKYMRADGARAFPSQATVEAQTRLSLRQVRASIQRAEADGWLVREKGRRANGQNWYMTYYTATAKPDLQLVLAQWKRDREAKKGPAESAAPTSKGPADSDQRTGKYRQKDRQDLPTNSLLNSHMNKDSDPVIREMQEEELGSLLISAAKRPYERKVFEKEHPEMMPHIQAVGGWRALGQSDETFQLPKLIRRVMFRMKTSVVTDQLAGAA
jgi:hypothetical protein